MNGDRFVFTKGPLPVILIAAVVQGWALYALHQSIAHKVWPATDSAWLLSLYALALFVPLTVQVLSEHVNTKGYWWIAAILGAAFFYFGWHHGANVYPGTAQKLLDTDEFVVAAFAMGLLWLLAMPFAQVRLATGGFQYTSLFKTTWRNKFLLAEAALFTGLFWLLLMLWQLLFDMLGIGFFKELFKEPLFIYPVTCVTFGIALHLIGAIENLTTAILEQVLNVLKWLAVVAGIILALFTLALLFKLPGLVFEGKRAIGAAWLLWLVAGIVLLMNAAYRDGSVERPYPAWMAFAFRCVIPLTVLISATALYALAIRTGHYGVTVERVWAFVVAGTALLYSVGYTIAAFGKGRWLEGMGSVNVKVAVALIATLAAMLTPVLSPYRLAANSQYRKSLEISTPLERDTRDSSFHYLRFQCGNYGMNRLSQLSTLKDVPNAELVRVASQRVLKLDTRWDRVKLDAMEAGDIVDKLVIAPPGHAIDASLRKLLVESLEKPDSGRPNPDLRKAMGGVFVDLRGDKSEDFVLLHSGGGNVYESEAGNWMRSSRMLRFNVQGVAWETLLEDLAAGKFSTEPAEWRVLKVGQLQFQVDER